MVQISIQACQLYMDHKMHHKKKFCKDRTNNNLDMATNGFLPPQKTQHPPASETHGSAFKTVNCTCFIRYTIHENLVKLVKSIYLDMVIKGHLLQKFYSTCSKNLYLFQHSKHMSQIHYSILFRIHEL